MKNLQIQLLSGALENARFGICVVDQSGRVILVNNAFVSKIGIQIENILGQSYLSLHSFFGENAEFHRLFSAHELDLSIECPLTKSDGQKQYLMLQSSVLPHESGELFRIVSLIDVTDYGMTRDRFATLQRQMDSLNNAVVIVDARQADMPITYVNAHFERMTGYPKSEVIGRNCRFLQGNERDQPGAAALRTAIQKRENCSVLLKNFRKDGSAFQNELFISPVFDELGVLTHFIGMQHEVMNRSSVASA